MHSVPLSISFYQQDTIVLAQKLLGQLLVHKLATGSKLVARIVETEAYLGLKDPAAHSYRGKTARNQTMFQGGGHLYVYFTYGMHYCCNVTSQADGEGVLIRAGEPIEGVEQMRALRGAHITLANLTNGPGKLTQALGINKSHDGAPLVKPPLFIAQGKTLSASEIITTTRIGISKAQDLPLRFYISHNPWVSRK